MDYAILKDFMKSAIRNSKRDMEPLRSWDQGKIDAFCMVARMEGYTALSNAGRKILDNLIFNNSEEERYVNSNRNHPV